ncbi:MAG TPA: hypothetical protein PLV13_10210 [Ilumatobacteraceae bacterium]|nr:hypothetical protein [Ilumatobacteraceae bacterium]
MFAVSLETAKTIGIVVFVAFVLIGVVSAWLIKTVVTKAIVALVMVGLAIAVYSQRASLQDCADKAKSHLGKEVSCTFFGTEVKVPAVDTP